MHADRDLPFVSLDMLLFAPAADFRCMFEFSPGECTGGDDRHGEGSPNHLWVGVAQFPLAADPLTNLMLGLPNDAICELPFTSTTTAENDPSAGCDE